MPGVDAVHPPLKPIGATPRDPPGASGARQACSVQHTPSGVGVRSTERIDTHTAPRPGLKACHNLHGCTLVTDRTSPGIAVLRPPLAEYQTKRGSDSSAPAAPPSERMRGAIFFAVNLMTAANGSPAPVLCRRFRCRSTPSPGSGAELSVHHTETCFRKCKPELNHSAVDRDRAVDHARFGRA